MTEVKGEISSAAVVAVVVVLVITGLVVDAVAGGARSVGPTLVEVPRVAGSSTCAALQLGDASQVTVTTVAAPREDDQDTAGVGDAAASLRLADDGTVRELADPAIDGAAVATAVAQGAWTRAPKGDITATRQSPTSSRKHSTTIDLS